MNPEVANSEGSFLEMLNKKEEEIEDLKSRVSELENDLTKMSSLNVGSNVIKDTPIEEPIATSNSKTSR